MGRDKALMKLAGKPLIRHAVKKLSRVCIDVQILTNNEQLEAFAPIVHDVHPGCGPMSGMEAGLFHSIFEWNLFMAVDMPFLPTAFISSWVNQYLLEEERGVMAGARVRMIEVDGRPQPGFCLLHKDVSPFLAAAIERGDYKLLPVLEAAARALAARNGFVLRPDSFCMPFQGFRSTRGEGKGEAWRYTSAAQRRAKSLWFANLNTPEEFAEAERHADVLDT
jgi:molybdopterin-guanine dinucleotide biosynthesis protein A